MPVSVGCSPGAVWILVGSPLAGHPLYQLAPADRATYTAVADAHPALLPALRYFHNFLSARPPSDGMRSDIALLVFLPLAAPPQVCQLAVSIWGSVQMTVGHEFAHIVGHH